MIRQVVAANVPPGQEALKGRIYALRVVSFTPGDKIAFNDPGNQIAVFAPGATYRRRRGFEKIYLTSAVPAQLAIEATEDVEEDLDPSTGLQYDANGRALIGMGCVFLPTILAPGNLNGIVGADMNSDDWTANQTRYSNWVDVSLYTALQLVSNFESLAGVNGADTVQPELEWSSDGHEAPFTAPMQTSGIGGAGIYQGNPTTTRFFTASKFARVKIAKGAVAGPHRLRVQWLGQLK